MNISNLPLAMLAYFEANLMPQIPSTLGRALTYGGMLLKIPELEKQIKQYAPMFCDSDGNIDIAKLRTVGVQVFEKVPLVKIGDFDFARADFENFMSFIEA